MENINETIDKISKFGSSLYGLSGFALTVVFCLVAGFVLKRYKHFPNEAIPAAVVFIGMLACVLLADPLTDSLPFRIWLTKNAVIGGIGGFVAWVLHAKLLKRVKLDSGNSDPAAFTKPKDS